MRHSRLIRILRFPCLALAIAATSNPARTALSADGADKSKQGVTKNDGPITAPVDERVKATFSRLRTVWTEQQSKIKTAAITFRSVRLAGSMLAENVTRSEFRTHFDSLNPAADAEELQELVRSFSTDRSPVKRAKMPGVKKEFLLTPDRRRETSDDTIQIVERKKSFYARQSTAHQQIDVYPERKGAYTMRLEDLRFFPSPVAATSVLEGKLTATRLPGVEGKWRIGHPASENGIASTAEFLVDESTGGALEFAFRDKHGDVTSEIFQGGFTIHPNGIVFPAYQVRATYRQQRLRSLFFTLITECKLNEPIAEERFRIPARKGDTLIDYRHDPQGHIEQLKADVADVRTLFPD